MNELINNGLVELQEEIQKLDSAVKQIDRAGQIAESVVEAVKNIQEKVSSYTQEVLLNYSNYLSNTSHTVTDNVQELTNSQIKQGEKLEGIMLEINTLTQRTSELLAKLENFDFNTKFNEISLQNNNTMQAVATHQSLTLTATSQQSKASDSVLAKISQVNETLFSLNTQNVKLLNDFMLKSKKEMQDAFAIQNKKLWNIRGLIYVLIFIMALFFAMTVVDYFDLLG